MLHHIRYFNLSIHIDLSSLIYYLLKNKGQKHEKKTKKIDFASIPVLQIHELGCFFFFGPPVPQMNQIKT